MMIFSSTNPTASHKLWGKVSTSEKHTGLDSGAVSCMGTRSGSHAVHPGEGRSATQGAGQPSTAAAFVRSSACSGILRSQMQQWRDPPLVAAGSSIRGGGKILRSQLQWRPDPPLVVAAGSSACSCSSGGGRIFRMWLWQCDGGS